MSGSDKKIGVVALTLFDLRKRAKVGRLGICGTTGAKFPAIRRSCFEGYPFESHDNQSLIVFHHANISRRTSLPSTTTLTSPLTRFPRIRLPGTPILQSCHRRTLSR